MLNCVNFGYVNSKAVGGSQWSSYFSLVKVRYLGGNRFYTVSTKNSIVNTKNNILSLERDIFYRKDSINSLVDELEKNVI